MKKILLSSFLLIANSVVAFSWGRNVLLNDKSNQSSKSSVLLSNCSVNENLVVSLENYNGNVIVKGHSANSVTVTMTMTGDKEYFSKVCANLTATSNILDIHTSVADNSVSNNVSVEYELLVPFGSQVKFLKTLNGTIEIHHVYGPLTCQTTNGEIDIENSRGTVNAQSSNGAISVSVDEFSKDAPLNLVTTNGSIIIENSQNSCVKATTSNGSIRMVSASVPEGSVVDLKTTNGEIECTLPKDVSTDLYARTSNGKIFLKFPHTQLGGILNATEVRAHIGNKSASIFSLFTGNNSITVKPVR